MRLNFDWLSSPLQNNRGNGGHRGQPVTMRDSGVPRSSEALGTGGDNFAAAALATKGIGAEMSPVSPSISMGRGQSKPSNYAAVPAVPRVPAKNDMDQPVSWRSTAVAAQSVQAVIPEADLPVFDTDHKQPQVRSAEEDPLKDGDGSAEAIDWHDDERRRCAHCLNLCLGGICKVAQPGGLVSAVKRYRPNQELPHRCAGYQPYSMDPDLRPGKERWPGI